MHWSSLKNKYKNCALNHMVLHKNFIYSNRKEKYICYSWLKAQTVDTYLTLTSLSVLHMYTSHISNMIVTFYA